MPRIFSLSAIFVTLFFSCKEKTAGPAVSVKQPVQVLFAASGYGSRIENISSNELINRLKNDSSNTFISEEVYELIKFILPRIKAQKINTIAGLPLSDTVIFITSIDNLTANTKALKVDGKDFFAEPLSYPLVSDKSGAAKIRDKITGFNLTGVTALTRGMCTAIELKGIDFIIRKIKPYFEKADFVHISNEVSFTGDCLCSAGTLRFCSKREHFQLLLSLHCNIAELTGNHNRDYGNAAFLETLKWYKGNGIKTFGGGATPEEANTPLIITLKDCTRLGLIGFNEICPLGECADIPGGCGANRYDKAKAEIVLKKMKEDLKCSFIIASVQFGESDTYYPTLSQKRICRHLINKGADMVYGSQAHQVQQTAFIRGKPVFYGLGNFLFDQLHRTALRQAYFLQMYFYNGKLLQARPVFTFMQNSLQPEAANKEETEAIRKEIFCDSLLYGR